MNLIENNELYNLSSDPEEKINVYDRFPKLQKNGKIEEEARIELGDNLLGVKGIENRGE